MELLIGILVLAAVVWIWPRPSYGERLLRLHASKVVKEIKDSRPHWTEEQMIAAAKKFIEYELRSFNTQFNFFETEDEAKNGGLPVVTVDFYVMKDCPRAEAVMAVFGEYITSDGGRAINLRIDEMQEKIKDQLSCTKE